VRDRALIVVLSCSLPLSACIGDLPPPLAQADAAPVGGAAPSAPVSVDPCPDLDGDGVAGCAGDCDDNASWVSPGRAERCNTIDDDCDGRAEEGFATVGQACEAGEGACRAVGVLACSADGLAVVCRAAEPPGSEEVRNRQDDDCDGRIDEGFANACTNGEVVLCDSPGQGVCRLGRSTCVDGAFSPCSGTTPSAELCNGLDDDCDGVADDAPTDVGAACGEGDPCSVGVVQCRDGARLCVPAMPRVDEACDAVDNDCDGEVDERVLNACGACGAEPPEACNGQDDDCDQRVDEETAGPNGFACAQRLSRLNPGVAGAELGRAVLVVPDVDGDGYADALIGAPGPDASGGQRPERAPSGDVYVVSGHTGEVLALLEGGERDYERGAALAVLRLGPEGRVLWVVGAPGFQTDREVTGQVELVDPVRREVVASRQGSGGGARFGAALASVPRGAGSGDLLVISAPQRGAHNEGALYAFDVDSAVDREMWDLVDDVKGPSADALLGRRLAVASWPGAESPVLFASRAPVNGLPDNSVAATNPLADFDALYVLTSPPGTRTEATYGLGLAARDRLVAIGAWSVSDPAGGAAPGRVWLYDAEMQAVVGEMVGAPGARLGASTLVTPPLKAGDPAGFCAGAYYDALAPTPSLPGMVRCDASGVAAERASRLRLPGDVAGDAFGEAIDIGAAPDPDGRLLLVVGAPRTRTAAGVSGAASLYRVAPLP